MPEAEVRKLRGNDVSMIFQEPMSSLNPVYTIGQQLCEVLHLHNRISRRRGDAAGRKAARGSADSRSRRRGCARIRTSCRAGSGSA